jgi:xanthine dehydrogenase accessory factor
VVDDRVKFANAERFPGAEIVVAPIPEWLGSADLAPSSYVVILTRGHTHDLNAVRVLAPRDLKYLGLIGSRAKIARITAALVDEGMPAETLRRLHAPVGISIGAVTPPEIAISILAELIAVRRGVNVDHLSMKDVRVPAPRDKDRGGVDADS